MLERHRSIVLQFAAEAGLVALLALALGAILLPHYARLAAEDARLGRSSLVRLGCALELYRAEHQQYPMRLASSERYRYRRTASRGADDGYLLRDTERYAAQALWDLPEGAPATTLCNQACRHIAYDPQYGLYGER